MSGTSLLLNRFEDKDEEGHQCNHVDNEALVEGIPFNNIINKILLNNNSLLITFKGINCSFLTEYQLSAIRGSNLLLSANLSKNSLLFLILFQNLSTK